MKLFQSRPSANDAKRNNGEGDEVGLGHALLAATKEADNNFFRSERRRFKEDLLEFQGRVVTVQDRKSALIKLERMPHGSIMRLIIVSILTALLCTALAIIFSVATRVQSVSDIQPVVRALVLSDGVIRTVSLGIISFVLVLFPQRAIVSAFKKNLPILPEQFLVVMLTLALLICPGTSYPFLVTFWETYVEVFWGTNSTDNRWTVSQSWNGHDSSLHAASIVLSELVVCLMYFLQLSLHGALSSKNSSIDSTDGISDGFLENLQDSSNRVQLQSHILPVSSNSNKNALVKAPRKAVKNAGKCAKCLFKVYYTVFKSLGDVSIGKSRWMLSLVIYIVLILTTAFLLDFTPSFIPLIGLITVIRVCTTTPSVPTFGLDSPSHDSCNISYPENSWCRDTTVRNRVIAEVFIFLVEFMLLVLYSQVTKISRKRLKKLPYDKFRSKHLGYKFFNFTTHLTFTAALFAGIFYASIPPVDWWIYINTGASENAFDEFCDGTDYLTPCPCEGLVLDPLHKLGISTDSTGFGILYYLFAIWIISLASAYLPPDSSGISGWFCSNPYTNLDDDDEPLYFVDEKRVMEYYESLVKPKKARFATLMQKLKAPSFRRKMKPKFSTSLDEGMRALESGNGIELTNRRRSNTSSLGSIVDKNHLSFQMSKRNIVVLETVCQLYSFAHLSYDICEDFSWNLPGLNESTHDAVEHNSKAKYKDHKLEHDIARERTESEHSESAKKSASPGSSVEGAKKTPLKISKSEHEEDVYVFTYDQNDVNEYVGGMGNIELVAHVFGIKLDSHAIIAKSEDRIIVSFRGTASGTNVKADLDYTMIVYPQADLLETEFNVETAKALVTLGQIEKPPKVHQGFYQSYACFQKTIRVMLTKLLMEVPERVIFCSGHSLGGAMASICALDIKLNLKEYYSGQVAVATFGSPKVGNYSFAKRYEVVIPNNLRFVFVGDFVPSLPPSKLWSGVTKLGYFHIGMRILLDGVGNMLLDPEYSEQIIYNAMRGYQTSRHFRGAYSLGLMTWGARTHGENFTPDWFLPIINHLSLFYPKEIAALPDQISRHIAGQLNKEGGFILRNKLQYRHMKTQTELLSAIELGSAVVDLLFDKMGFSDAVRNEYKHLFVSNGYDTIGAIKLMTIADLTAIGIHKLGHQNLILHEINFSDSTDLGVQNDDGEIHDVESNADEDDRISDITITDDGDVHTLNVM